MPQDELRAIGRVKQASDSDSMRYITIGSIAAKAVWFIGGCIILVTLWAARLEWKMQANTHNIDKIWNAVFKHEPMKDE